MLKTVLMLSSLVLFSSASFAESTYLDCQVASKTEQKKFSVRLDEASGKVTHTSEDGSAFNAEGFFAANSISYQRISLSGDLKITFRYEIDRSNLKIKEVFEVAAVNPKIAAQVPAKILTMDGSCSVVKVGARKI
jgi:hypothetical protein